MPKHFELTTPTELAEQIHRGHIAMSRMNEIAPIVVDEAHTDAVAAEIMERLADEIAALARVAIERLSLAQEPVEVLLGGGLAKAADGPLADAVAARVREVAHAVTVASTSSPPIVGAALLGLDELGADAAAHNRLRRELGDRFAQIGKEAGS